MNLPVLSMRVVLIRSAASTASSSFTKIAGMWPPMDGPKNGLRTGNHSTTELPNKLEGNKETVLKQTVNYF